MAWILACDPQIVRPKAVVPAVVAEAEEREEEEEAKEEEVATGKSVDRQNGSVSKRNSVFLR